MPRLVVVSDTHNRHRDILMPDGDIVIHCGDASVRGTRDELEEFVAWFASLPHCHKLMVGGNHDDWLEFHPELAREAGISFMWDSGVLIDGISFYGSPYRTVSEDRIWLPKTHRRWSAFMITEVWAAHAWSEIPLGLDVLVTHQPPKGLLDAVNGKMLGSTSLREAVDRIKPKVHVFGHIHDAYGRIVVGSTTFINAAICDGSGGPSGAGEPTNQPVIVDL